jgi:hypothetical protein
MAAAHLSHVYLTSRNHQAALEFATHPVVGGSPRVRYLRLLFAGMALERLGRLDEARVAYSDARLVLPGAQSAVLAMAGVNSRLSMSTVDIPGMWLAADAEHDPYRLFFYGDYMHWDNHIADVRSGLR